MPAPSSAPPLEQSSSMPLQDSVAPGLTEAALSAQSPAVSAYPVGQPPPVPGQTENSVPVP